MRDLKRHHSYSIQEQEGMLPFERDMLMVTLHQETLKDREIPVQGWSKYAEEVGATQKTNYTDKFKVVDY
jgi:hypothetical protein